MNIGKPILMNGEMVWATLEGRKTQTRRVLDPQPEMVTDKSIQPWEGDPAELMDLLERNNRGCPFGKPGDIIWVRETFDVVPRSAFARSTGVDQIIRPGDDHDAAIYRAGWERSTGGISWKPSIHMPRWASRITLEITDVRVERLQDISEEDAKAEGAQYFPDLPGKNPWGQDTRWSMQSPKSVDQCLGSARTAFANFFCRLYGKYSKSFHDPAPWDSNPWVWVIDYRTHHMNIDALIEQRRGEVQ